LNDATTQDATAAIATDTPAAILMDYAGVGLVLDVRGEKIVARPSDHLTPKHCRRIVENRVALLDWLHTEAREGYRLELKRLVTPLVGRRGVLVDDILTAWKWRIDRGRAEGEPVADYERAALTQARRAMAPPGAETHPEAGVFPGAWILPGGVVDTMPGYLHYRYVSCIMFPMAGRKAVKRRIPPNAGFCDQIRRAVDGSDLSRYQICKRLGIAESSMSRFMAGGWFGQDNLNALANLLGLEVGVKCDKRATRKGR